MPKYIYLPEIDYKHELLNDVIISKNKIMPFNLILTKNYELYEIDQIVNFPNAYYVHVLNDSKIYDIKNEYNKHSNKIKNINDVYKTLFNILK